MPGIVSNSLKYSKARGKSGSFFRKDSYSGLNTATSSRQNSTTALSRRNKFLSQYQLNKSISNNGLSASAPSLAFGGGFYGDSHSTGDNSCGSETSSQAQDTWGYFVDIGATS